MSISWLPARRPASRCWPTSLLTAVVVLAACLGGLGTAYGFAKISTGRPVLTVTGTVLQGAVIQSDDLGVAEVTAPGVPTVPVASREAVVGSRARHTLMPGSLLAPGDFGQPALPDGLTQVALRLGPGQVPSAPLPGGQRVLLLGLPGADDPEGDVLPVSAQIVWPPEAKPDGTCVMSVAVPAGDAEALAPYLLNQRVTVIVGGRIDP